MKLNNEKGITNIDITVSIILITIFITIITTLTYIVNINSDFIERRSKALHYAILEIEELKSQEFSVLIDTNEATNSFKNIIDEEGNVTGYSKKVTIIDYANLPENQNNKTIKKDIVKKVTVEILYRENNIEKIIDLSTVIANDN